MKIGIIDADLIGRYKHRFPNLACEKISAYWKEEGATVTLLPDYLPVEKIFDRDAGYNSPRFWDVEDYDRIYVSKVFTDTPYPEWLCTTDTVIRGGTGFYFDKAAPLDDEVERHMPDYTLYDDWIENTVAKAQAEYTAKGRRFNETSYRLQFREYKDYAIGFLTRGCFRHCPFCVNQRYNQVKPSSELWRFYDPENPRLKKICLLDDNFLGYPEWESLLRQLIDVGKPFKFKQGLDERLLTDRMCDLLFHSNYDGDYTFAFDNYKDYDLIHRKLDMIRKHTNSLNIKFYVLVGFESTDETDIEHALARIALLMEHKCLPYLMRYQNKNDTPWKHSEYSSLYSTLARWCNQPSFFKKMSFEQFCIANQNYAPPKDGGKCSSLRAMEKFWAAKPDIAEKYFRLRYEDYL